MVGQMTEELHEVSIEAARRRELAQRRAEEAERFVRQNAFDRPIEDPVARWRREAEEKQAAVARETRRRQRKEDREAQLEQRIADLTARVEELEAENAFAAEALHKGADALERELAYCDRLERRLLRYERRNNQVTRR
jgi:hypothetical protein